ncbi:MAG: hypothetical protein AB7S26_20795 [Sandaracinaceae bacterium]
MSTLRATAVLGLLLLTGCGGDDWPTTDGSVGDTITFTVEAATPDGVRPVATTGDALLSWEWGFQGGTMIQPVLVLDPSQVRVGTTLDVVLRHTPDPAAPDRFGQIAGFPELRMSTEVYRAEDGRLVVGPFQDQIGNSELDGLRLTLSIEVSSSRHRPASWSTTVELAPMMTNTSCEPFAVIDAGCTYREIPGVAMVALEAPLPSESSCTDATRVRLTFAPDDPTLASACATSLGWTDEALLQDRTFTVSGSNPPTSCLDEVGLTEGASVPASVWIIERGTCPPAELQLQLDATACTEQCMF